MLPSGKHVQQIVAILVGQRVGEGSFVRNWMCQCVAVRKSDRLKSCSTQPAIILTVLGRSPYVLLDCVLALGSGKDVTKNYLTRVGESGQQILKIWC